MVDCTPGSASSAQAVEHKQGITQSRWEQWIPTPLSTWSIPARNTVFTNREKPSVALHLSEFAAKSLALRLGTREKIEHINRSYGDVRCIRDRDLLAKEQRQAEKSSCSSIVTNSSRNASNMDPTNNGRGDVTVARRANRLKEREKKAFIEGMCSLVSAYFVSFRLTDFQYNFIAFWKENMSPEELFEATAQSMLACLERDAASGWGVVIYTITKDKVNISTLKGRMD
ncbi:hypothetical protein TELCIR_16261 [Teladorsagia circumcincta]|uniref:Uncharacterized protein n=1 Tax=Teladorsagia circumcincta TaxID=45464 RepID=A0A2G9TXM0_TELCI|nr:hypothetical protein TELCIR_16261 [Teladorsagia circumcincta]